MIEDEQIMFLELPQVTYIHQRNRNVRFFSGIVNFGSKILGGVKKVAQWVTSALHKILSTASGPVGMTHPGIRGALGAGANLAGAVDRLVNKS
ncbi:MAG: hypothetical protein EZS28_023068 [Streblomastix strix]|uniref:Uncharacterized protein n=1 Tax=Streblomastix strix TaxID=222440 RepID=A0A5J4VG38_9EUKA|nr:MAG: hypothetical protein EZS28_023068 [Streblomastix strix]